MAAPASADLLCRSGRRNSLHVAGEIRRALALDVRGDTSGAHAMPRFHLETSAAQTRPCREARRHHSAYGVPSRLVPSDPLRTSKIPGSVWFTVLVASSMTSFQLSELPAIGWTGT